MNQIKTHLFAFVTVVLFAMATSLPAFAGALGNTQFQALALQASTTLAGSGATPSTAVTSPFLKQARAIVAALNVSAIGSTGQTFIASIQTSFDGGTTWVNHPGGVYTTVTNAVSSESIRILGPFGDRIRLLARNTGATGSVTFSVKGWMQD